MSAASDLANWLAHPDPMRQHNDDLFRAFVEDADIAVEDAEAFDDDPAEWVKANYPDDFAIWFDNALPDLVERYEIESNNGNIDSANQMRAGTWFIHFTNAEFTQFADGVTREFLGRSGEARNRVIACPQNLSLPPDQQKWIHAYPVFGPFDEEHPSDEVSRSGMGYGHNALLFQSDAAVVGRHVAHEEYMAFVLGCSEYNAVLLTGLAANYVKDDGYERRTLAGTAHLARGELDFDDIERLIEGLARTAAAGLGRVARRSRWHRLAWRPSNR